MSLNSVNERYFDWLPKNKTMFPLKKRVMTSMNLGEFTPLGFFEGLPGDTFNFSTKSIMRITSPLTKATMETLDVHYAVFSVPLRIVYDNFKKVMGERDDYETAPDSDYEIPEIKFVDDKGQPINNYAKNILAYLGVPIPSPEDIQAGRTLHGINKILSNAYALIWNEHIRDQNLQQAKLIDTSDNDILNIAENDPDADFHTSAPDKYTGKLAHVNRNFDYFSNVFTDTQKGEQVTLSLSGNANVITTDTRNGLKGFGMTFSKATDGKPWIGISDKGSEIGIDRTGPLLPGIQDWAGADPARFALQPDNLMADLSNIGAFNVNDLREVEHLQKRRELDLVAGTRYFEIVDNYFNVKNALARLDVPEFIAYSSGELHMSQVVQTSGGIAGESTEQGNIAGYGVEAHTHGQVNVTLQEHAVIMPFVYVTQRHRYQQGTHKFLNRKTKTDFFDVLQIGNGFQPIMKSEIYGHLTDAEKDDVWAFAPNAERYRKQTDIITGMLNVNSTGSISTWHAGDTYSAPPTYDGTWKIEKPDYLDNALVFGSKIVDQFIMDVSFEGIKVSVVDPLGVPQI